MDDQTWIVRRLNVAPGTQVHYGPYGDERSAVAAKDRLLRHQRISTRTVRRHFRQRKLVAQFFNPSDLRIERIN